MCLSSFLDIAVSIFDFAPYYAEFDRILNSSYLKSVVFLIDIYIPWSKFYMSGNWMYSSICRFKSYFIYGTYM